MDNLKKLYKNRIKGLKYESTSKPTIIAPLLIILLSIVLVTIIFKFDLISRIISIIPSNKQVCTLSVNLMNGKADVLIDEKQIGSTPIENYRVECKEHTVTVKKQSPNETFYYQYNEKIPLSTNESINLTLNLGASFEGSEILLIRNTPSKISSVSFFTEEVKGDIYIDGSLHGNSPYTFIPDSEKSNEIIIKAEGYKSQEFTINTYENTTTTIQSKLMLIPILYE
ncbi:MAG TPA: PEGA domain-containing protein [Candidatus Dojkabacteria bacterium]|nr:PEGA domain-containing protein [Candidatus Dojkabacteria bacterium]HQF36304.1 PEGA domain-containing protein [Candidatus Dojkabacteria bacterium]